MADEATVKTMVREWLEAHGYDGLYGGDCGCRVGDLAPCQCFSECFGEDCRPGYRIGCEPSECGMIDVGSYCIGPKGAECPMEEDEK